jgi:glycosyltransferase involved in cell wall biosynthesis
MIVGVYCKLTSLEHPYFRAFHAALCRQGVSISDDVEIRASWLGAHAGRIRAVHMHWPETIWQPPAVLGDGARARLHAVYHIARLWRFLRLARRLGVTIAWTVHNLEPHEGVRAWDRLGYHLVASHADLIVCHSQSACEATVQRYTPRGRVLLMPMGALAEGYPPPQPRDAVLRQLGLDPSRPVLACVGRLRQYKGLDLACDAVARLGGRVQLIVAGPVQAGFDPTPLTEAAATSTGLVAIARRLTDQEFADVLGSSDGVLLPYRSVTGSAVLLTALGFGRGVIVAGLPYFREVLAPEPDAGIVVDDQDVDSWARAIEHFVSRPAATWSAAARRLADRYSWDESSARVVAALDAARA